MIYLERPVNVTDLRSLSWLVGKLVDRGGELHLVRPVSTRREGLELVAQITLQPFTGDPARHVTATGPAVELLDSATTWIPPTVPQAVADPMPELRSPDSSPPTPDSP